MILWSCNSTLTQYQKNTIEIIPFREMLYSAKQSRYFPVDQFPNDETPLTISGTELRDRCKKFRHTRMVLLPSGDQRASQCVSSQTQSKFMVLLLGCRVPGKKSHLGKCTVSQ